MAHNYRDLGILTNRDFLQHFISESPLRASVKFACIDRWPVVPSYNHKYLIMLCYVYSEARYAYSRITNPGLRKTMTSELLSPKIPDAKYSDRDSARASYLEYVRYAINNDIFNPLGEFTPEEYQVFRRDPEVIMNFPVRDFPDTYPWTLEQILVMSFDESVFITFFYYKHLILNMKQFAIETITLAYYAKRGD